MDGTERRAAEQAAAMPTPVPGPVADADALSDGERDILDFERQWFRYAGVKEQSVRETLGLSATRYYQVLNGLIDRPAAHVYDPMLVKRLRRLRAARQRARGARVLGGDL